MSFESNPKSENIVDQIESAKKEAPLRTIANNSHTIEAGAEAEFIKGSYDLLKFKEELGNIPELGGKIYFDTLPEFISAIRQIISSKEIQDEILDHENAHALEATQRGYAFRYKIEFARDEKKLFVVKLMRTGLSAAGVDVDYFSKNEKMPSEHELREDLIAIISALETLTDGTLSRPDKLALGRD